MERPTIDQITVSDTLIGFEYILHISDRNVFYSAALIKDIIIADPDRLDSIPIISVNSATFKIPAVNQAVDDILIFDVSKVEPLTDLQVIQCVAVGVKITDADIQLQNEFVITPKEIEFDTPFIDQPTFDNTPSTSTKITEKKPTSPPSGYIPFVNKKTGTISPGGNYIWDGANWNFYFG